MDSIAKSLYGKSASVVSDSQKNPDPMPSIDPRTFERLVATHGAGSPHVLQLNTMRPHYCTKCGEDMRPWWAGKPSTCDGCLGVVRHVQTERKVEQAAQGIPEAYRDCELGSQVLSGRLQGNSQALHVHEKLLGFATKPRNVLLLGKPGTGKRSLIAACVLGMIRSKPSLANPSYLLWLKASDLSQSLKKQQANDPNGGLERSKKIMILCLTGLGSEPNVEGWLRTLDDLIQARTKFSNLITLATSECSFEQLERMYGIELFQLIEKRFGMFEVDGE